MLLFQMDVVHLRLLRGVAAILADVHLRIASGEEQNKHDFKCRRYSNLLLIKTCPDQGSMKYRRGPKLRNEELDVLFLRFGGYVCSLDVLVKKNFFQP